jgi:hypothetical protein
MKAIIDFSLSIAHGLGLKAGMAERLLKRAALERIATGLSLTSQAVGVLDRRDLDLSDAPSSRTERFRKRQHLCNGRRPQRSFRGRRVPHRRSSVLEVLRQAFSGVGVQTKNCSPNFRETRIKNSNRVASFDTYRR